VLAEYLDDEVPLPIHLVNPLQDKTTRLMEISPLIEGGRFLFDPSLRPTNIRDRERGDLVTQLLQFPLSRHDDMVDAMVHATKFAYDLFLRKRDRVPRVHLRIRAL
jgi:predicted phage terminase large subunit-like protein